MFSTFRSLKLKIPTSGLRLQLSHVQPQQADPTQEDRFLTILSIDMETVIALYELDSIDGFCICVVRLGMCELRRRVFGSSIDLFSPLISRYMLSYFHCRIF